MNKNQLDSLKAESEVFDRIFNEFVVKSYFRFTHETFICFVLEFMYGDFSQILKTYGCLDQSTSRFYIAELILAVEHLHSLNIIHRDLKPDNMLMDDKGHIKLTDFGLSDTCMKMYKNNKRKTFIGEEQMGDFITKSDYKIPLLDNPISYICNGSQTNKKSLKHSNFIYNRIIGTPDYMSPEIINGNIGDNNNYLGKNLDWWSIGVILFEFLVGIPPFNDDTVDKIFENISNHAIPWDQIEIGYEEGQLSLEAYDLINQLLNPRVEERLGSVSVEDIKKHNFFKGFFAIFLIIKKRILLDFDWNEIRNRTPPIIPEIQTPDKISTRSNLNFEEKEFKEPFMIMKYQNENHVFYKIMFFLDF